MFFPKLMAPALMLCGAAAAVAGTVVDEKLLGLTEQSLKDQLPAVMKLEKPVWGPHRVRGTYALGNAVFYFQNGRVNRIEQRLSYPVAQCDAQYASLNASLDATYGEEPRANGEAQSNAWSPGVFNVYLYKMLDAKRCDILVVFAPHTAIDASEL
jgi:hypothetical protein